MSSIKKELQALGFQDDGFQYSYERGPFLLHIPKTKACHNPEVTTLMFAPSSLVLADAWDSDTDTEGTDMKRLVGSKGIVAFAVHGKEAVEALQAQYCKDKTLSYEAAANLACSWGLFLYEGNIHDFNARRRV